MINAGQAQLSTKFIRGAIRFGWVRLMQKWNQTNYFGSCILRKKLNNCKTKLFLGLDILIVFKFFLPKSYTRLLQNIMQSILK